MDPKSGVLTRVLKGQVDEVLAHAAEQVGDNPEVLYVVVAGDRGLTAGYRFEPAEHPEISVKLAECLERSAARLSRSAKKAN